MSEGDGVNETVEGVGRVTAMAVGALVESEAVRRANEHRAAAAGSLAGAAGDRSRAGALAGVDGAVRRERDTAVAVLAADRAAVLGGRLTPDVAEAVTVAAVSQGRPAAEATVSGPGGGRPPRGRRRGVGAERDLTR